MNCIVKSQPSAHLLSYLAPSKDTKFSHVPPRGSSHGVPSAPVDTCSPCGLSFGLLMMINTSSIVKQKDLSTSPKCNSYSNTVPLPRRKRTLLSFLLLFVASHIATELKVTYKAF